MYIRHDGLFCFGQNRGQTIKLVDTTYLEWMLASISKLTDDEKALLSNELSARKHGGSAGQNNYQRASNGAAKRTRTPAIVTTETILEVITAGRQSLAKRHHPDAGGSHEKMVAINATADFLETQARELVGAR